MVARRDHAPSKRCPCSLLKKSLEVEIKVFWFMAAISKLKIVLPSHIGLRPESEFRTSLFRDKDSIDV